MSLFKIKEEEIIAGEEDKVLAKTAIDKARVKVAATRNIRVVLILVSATMIVIPIVNFLPQNISILYRIILGIVIGALIAGVITILLSFHYPSEVKKEYQKQLSELKTRAMK